MLSSAAQLCGNHSGEAERDSGVGLKLFGFIAESVFAFIPESRSGSSRNALRHHRGIAFILPRIPHAPPRRYRCPLVSQQPGAYFKLITFCKCGAVVHGCATEAEGLSAKSRRWRVRSRNILARKRRILAF